RVHCEGGGDVLLGGEQAGQVGVDLAYLAVGAGGVDAVAVRRAGGPAHEVVALVRGHDEEGVIFVDAVGLQAIEEGGEGRVVGAQGGHVVGLAGAVCAARGAVEVVRVGDVGIGDGDAVLLHGGDVGERLGRRHTVE